MLVDASESEGVAITAEDSGPGSRVNQALWCVPIVTSLLNATLAHIFVQTQSSSRRMV